MRRSFVQLKGVALRIVHSCAIHASAYEGRGNTEFQLNHIHILYRILYMYIYISMKERNPQPIAIWHTNVMNLITNPEIHNNDYRLIE